MIKNAVIMPNVLRDTDYSVTEKVCATLNACGINTYICDECAGCCGTGIIRYRKGTFPDADVIIVIGGDGSVLDACAYAVKYDIPVLGVNKGHLGYLTSIEENETEKLTRLSTGEYSLKNRSLLCGKAYVGGHEIPLPDVINDYVFTHREICGMIDYDISDGGVSRLEYSSDALVVSSPCGSSAYSLSAGGPLLDADLSAICVTPVAPHSFFGRSIVFGADSVIKIANSTYREVPIEVVADGRHVLTLSHGDSVTVTQSDKVVKMISFDGSGILDKLCRKMKMSNAKYNR